MIPKIFNLVSIVLTLLIKNVQAILLKVVQRNAFFAHPENVFIALLCDKDKNVPWLVVSKAQSFKANMLNFSFVAHSEEGYSDANPDVQFLIRQFCAARAESWGQVLLPTY